jgi:NitT/TauT family transport system permease protein
MTSLAADLREAWIPNGHVTKRVHRIFALGTIAVLISAWSLRPTFLPSLADVVRVYPRLIDMGLFDQLFVSLTTNLQAIGITCLLTIPLAYLTVVPALRPFVQWLGKGRFLGMAGFVVLFTLLFGGGHGLKVALLVFGLGVFLITSLYDIVEAIPREEFDHARTLRLGPWGSVIEIMVLGHLDGVIDAVRQNAAMGWVMLTMVEGLVRFEGGLGAMMLAEDKHIQLDAVFAIQAVVLGIGILQDWAFVGLRKVLCPYADLTLERR